MIAEEQPKKTGGGRKPTFLLNDEVLAKVTALAQRGLNQKMIAGYFGVSKTVWELKKKKFPELREAYLKGKSKGVSFVSEKLMELIKTGNVTAITYYLKTVGEFSETPEPDDIDDAPKKKHVPLKITVTDPIEAAKIYQQIMQGSK